MKIKFAEDLATDVKIWVHADAESKAAMEAFNKAKAEPDEPKPRIDSALQQPVHERVEKLAARDDCFAPPAFLRIFRFSVKMADLPGARRRT